MSTRARRLLWTLGIPLALGLAMNIAVAWTLVILVPVPIKIEDHVSDMMKRSRAEGVLRSRIEFKPFDWTYVAGHELTTAGRTYQTVLLSQRDYREDGEPGESFIVRFRIWQAGWPCRSMRSEERMTGSWAARPMLGGAWRIGWLDERFKANNSPGLPLWPNWPGFALSTAFYAFGFWSLWMLLRAPFWVRSVIRRARGHCGRCGYDLAGVAHTCCPECGAPAQVKPRPPQPVAPSTAS